MMPINFSHKYEKLHRGKVPTGSSIIPKSADLVSAAVFNKSQLPEAFLDWDTLYYTEVNEEKHYELEGEKYIVLIFFDEDGQRLFSTLRPYTERKFAYYLSMVGRKFDVILT